jgi:hypothetical protein
VNSSKDPEIHNLMEDIQKLNNECGILGVENIISISRNTPLPKTSFIQ